MIFDEAEQLFLKTKSVEDIFKWKLPHDFPPELAYDNILKE